LYFVSQKIGQQNALNRCIAVINTVCRAQSRFRSVREASRPLDRGCGRSRRSTSDK